MNDLIRREDVIKLVDQFVFGVRKEQIHEAKKTFIEYIKKMPTAYDIDNVVNELKQAIQNGTIKIEVGNSKLFEIVNQGSISKNICEWEYDKHFEFAKSKCGSIDTHRIEFNKLKYCPYCGKPIKIIN